MGAGIREIDPGVAHSAACLRIGELREGGFGAQSNHLRHHAKYRSRTFRLRPRGTPRQMRPRLQPRRAGSSAASARLGCGSCRGVKRLGVCYP